VADATEGAGFVSHKSLEGQEESAGATGSADEKPLTPRQTSGGGASRLQKCSQQSLMHPF